MATKTLSVFGVGEDLSDTAWRGVLRQLLAQGLLTVDNEGFGTLALTEGSRAVLKGERQLMLRRESEKKTRSGKTSSGRPKAAAIDLPPELQPVFEALRAWRGEVAKSHGVPAYVIFHDATLREIALAQPESMDALSHISGGGRPQARSLRRRNPATGVQAGPVAGPGRRTGLLPMAVRHRRPAHQYEGGGNSGTGGTLFPETPTGRPGC